MRPTLYFLADCPFCLKVRLYLIEAGIADTVDQILFSRGDAQETVLRSELTELIGKVSYPAARFDRDDIAIESDVIVNRLQAISGVPAGPVLTTYAQAILPKLGELYRENMMLKAALTA